MAIQNLPELLEQRDLIFWFHLESSVSRRPGLNEALRQQDAPAVGGETQMTSAVVVIFVYIARKSLNELVRRRCVGVFGLFVCGVECEDVSLRVVEVIVLKLRGISIAKTTGTQSVPP